MAARPKTKPRTPARQPGARTSVPAAPLAKPEAPTAAPAASASPNKNDDGPPPDKPSGEVVRLDRFRKK